MSNVLTGWLSLLAVAAIVAAGAVLATPQQAEAQDAITNSPIIGLITRSGTTLTVYASANAGNPGLIRSAIMSYRLASGGPTTQVVFRGLSGGEYQTLQATGVPTSGDITVGLRFCSVDSSSPTGCQNRPGAGTGPHPGPATAIARVDSGNVILSWTETGRSGIFPSRVRYAIFRAALAPTLAPTCPAVGDASYAEITSPNARVSTLGYTDSGPPTNTRYCYYIAGSYPVTTTQNVLGPASPTVLATVGTIAVPPPAITGGQATGASSRSLEVRWTPSAEAQLYRVQWKSGAEQYDTAREQTAVFPPIIIPDLAPSTTYTLRIRGERSTAQSAWSADFTGATLAANTPPQPNSLRLVNRDETSLSFTWNIASDEDNPVTEWIINYRSVGGGAWTELTSAPGPDGAPVEYTIPTLMTGVNYEVRVRGRNAIGLGGWSIIRAFATSEDQFATIAPDDLRITDTEQTDTALSVTLQWNALPSVTGYRLTREHTQGGDTTTAHILSQGTTATDVVAIDLTTAGRVSYIVQGINAANAYSGNSNRVSTQYNAELDAELPDYLEAQPTYDCSPESMEAMAGGATITYSDGSVAPADRNLVEQARVHCALYNLAEFVGNSGGFTTDAQGLLNFLVGAACLIVLAVSGYLGNKYRQQPLAVGFGVVTSLLIMAVGVAYMGFPPIWLVLVTWTVGGIGCLGFYRLMMQERIGEIQGYLFFVAMAAAVHISLAIAQALGGYVINGNGAYEGILGGTPIGNIIGIKAPTSITDFGALFDAIANVFQGLGGIMLFDYPILDVATGAAAWIARAIIFAATIGQALLVLFIVRSVFSTGVLNSTAGLIIVGAIGAGGALAKLLGLV